MSYNVFVYCSGKSGSSTLYQTFLNNGYKSIHIHSNLYYKNTYQSNNDIFSLIDMCCKKQENIYFIDSYRTPIERKISSFFQNINGHVPNYLSLSLDELINVFNEQFLFKLANFHSINELFDHYEITRWTEFNFEKKYNILKKDNKIFIKILFKDIKEWDMILEEIFSKKIIIINDNLTHCKPINKLYENFKKNYKVPKKYLEHLIEKDTEFKIYNTVKEQEEYINKWTELSF